ncbi:transcriptional regulator [Haliangium sp. UPWRP_2]|nr:transcriptional regulator [Haliangium sp. UPWRP_2]
MSSENRHPVGPPTDTPTGKQIAAARSLLGMTQRELARASNIAQGTLATLETGKRTPTKNNLAAVVQALQRRGIRFYNGDSPTVQHVPPDSILP